MVQSGGGLVPGAQLVTQLACGLFERIQDRFASRSLPQLDGHSRRRRPEHAGRQFLRLGPPTLPSHAGSLLDLVALEPPLLGLLRQLGLLGRVLDFGELVGFGGSDLPGIHHDLDGLGQVQQGERLGDRPLSDVQPLGELDLVQAAARHQCPVGLGLLDRPQVLPETVLDELLLEDLVLGKRPRHLDGRDEGQPGLDRGAPAALAGDDYPFPHLGIPPHADRLEQAAFHETPGQPTQALGIELLSGLVRVRDNPVRWDLECPLDPVQPGMAVLVGRPRSLEVRRALCPTLMAAHGLSDVRARDRPELFGSLYHAHAASLSAAVSGAVSLTRARNSSATAAIAFAAAARGLCKATGRRQATASTKSLARGTWAAKTSGPYSSLSSAS